MVGKNLRHGIHSETPLWCRIPVLATERKPVSSKEVAEAGLDSCVNLNKGEIERQSERERERERKSEATPNMTSIIKVIPNLSK